MNYKSDNLKLQLNYKSDNLSNKIGTRSWQQILAF